MTILAKILTGAAGLAMVAGAAAPAAAQTYPYGGYNQGYGTNGGVGAIIGQILGGGRYGAYGQGNDRVAVDQCARAAEARVSAGYRAPGYGNYPQGYANQGYAQGYPNPAYGYNQAVQARVIGITAVERRSSGLKVSGVIDSGRSQYRGAYGNQGYGYGSPPYAGQNYPNQGYYPNQAYPNQAYPNQGYPNQGYPNQGYPNQYGNAYAYGQPAQVADLRFSCRVDYRGYVTALDIKRNVAARRGY